jgi:hypothetical protein
MVKVSLVIDEIKIVAFDDFSAPILPATATKRGCDGMNN